MPRILRSGDAPGSRDRAGPGCTPSFPFTASLSCQVGRPGRPVLRPPSPLCRSSWRGRGTGQGQPASSSPATEEAQAPPFPASELLPHLARQLLCAPPLVCSSGSHGRASSLPACSWGERRRRSRPRSRAGCLSPGGRPWGPSRTAPRQKGAGLLPCAHPGQRMRRPLALDPGARWAPAGKESFPQTRVFRGWETRAPVHKRARRRRGEIGARIDVLPHFWRSPETRGGQEPPQLYPLGLARRSPSTRDGACKVGEGGERFTQD